MPNPRNIFSSTSGLALLAGGSVGCVLIVALAGILWSHRKAAAVKKRTPTQPRKGASTKKPSPAHSLPTNAPSTPLKTGRVDALRTAATADVPFSPLRAAALTEFTRPGRAALPAFFFVVVCPACDAERGERVRSVMSFARACSRAVEPVDFLWVGPEQYPEFCKAVMHTKLSPRRSPTRTHILVVDSRGRRFSRYPGALLDGAAIAAWMDAPTEWAPLEDFQMALYLE
ncbi:hypothetical protein PAPYR_5642 [Paratrimastix pyriformis]|uniref:Thioredoxin domain-containing protein n=1 Tax=Paratrimastix pyriformis TaxID=342808 RepID=A0ABQ8UJS3_9EUKA|nr:hypothetical protein PAPYR_5642 [Paratrimastix pyriformis]